jgi:hypothetical protein
VTYTDMSRIALRLSRAQTRRAVLHRSGKRREEARQAWLEVNEPQAPGSIGAPEAELHRTVWGAINGRPDFIPDPTKSWKDYVAEIVSQRAEEAMHLLAGEAERGNRDAATAFAMITVRLVGKLNALADSTPDALKSFARSQISWPVLKSPHRHFTQQEDDYFRALGVGQDAPWKTDESADWSPHDPAGKLAVEICRELNDVQRNWRFIGSFRPLADWESLAAKLPRFSGKTAAVAQWERAVRAFAKAHPEKLPPLNKRVPKSKRRRDGGISSHVFTMLKDKLRSMAGLNKY